jgi:hypothetical protein
VVGASGGRARAGYGPSELRPGGLCGGVRTGQGSCREEEDRANRGLVGERIRKRDKRRS